MKKFFAIIIVVLSAVFITASFGLRDTYAAASSKDFVVAYYPDENSQALSTTTKVVFGTSTKTKTAAELKLSKNGSTFAGWKAYRDSDDKWLLTDSSGNQAWTKVSNGNLPSGYTYTLLKDGVKLAKTSAGGTVHFYAQWNSRDFTVMYHKDDSSNALSQTTKIPYGTSTPTLTTSALKISKSGSTFAGWKAYRDMDDKWLLTDAAGNQAWTKVNNGNLPSGYTYTLLKDGVKLAKTSSGGTVHFYAQWKTRDFTVMYHKDDSSNALSQTTTVPYGTSTPTLTTSALKISKSGSTFTGWKAYRDMDDKWLLTDAAGNQAWTKVSNGNLPSGYTYTLLKDGVKLAKTSSGGTVHFYAQWKSRNFEVAYHADDNANPLSTKTTVVYGVSTPTKTTSELNIKKSGKEFTGWKAYRDMDDKWLLTDASGNQAWTKVSNGNLPSGHTYTLLKDGVKLAKTSSGGTVHFYAQWKEKSKDFIVAYHPDDDSPALSTTTKVTFGTGTKTKTISELGISKNGAAFEGWKAYRDSDDKWLVADDSGNQSWMKLSDGNLPDGYDYSLLRNGVGLAKTSAGGTVHLYAQWVETRIDASKYITGSGTDITSGLQKCLDYAKTTQDHIEVIVPEGTYHINKSLTIYSGTTLKLDPNTVIIRDNPTASMLRSYSDQTTGGYGQAQDIRVEGGTWDGNVTDTGILCESPLMTFKHAHDIELENLTIKNFNSRHMVTLSGVKDVVVRSVKFEDQKEYTGEDPDHVYFRDYEDEDFSKEKSFLKMEALHFDYISADGLSEPGALPWDDTVCDGIIVENCEFKNVFSGMGGHYTTDEAPSNHDLTLSNNTFKNIKCVCIHPVNFDSVVINDNEATRVGGFIRINKSTGSIINNTATIDTSSHEIHEDDMEITSMSLSGILAYDNSHLVIEGNTIINPSNSGISMNMGTTSSSIKGNRIENPRNHGITVYQASADMIEENTITGADNNGINVNEGSAVVSNNTITDSKNNGISFAASSGSAENNTINGAAGYGIVLMNATMGRSFSNNIITDTTDHGIALYYDSYAAAINGNRVSNSQQSGITTVDSSADTINGNTVEGSVKNAIHLYNSKNSEVKSNILNNVGNEGIVIDGACENVSVLSNTVTEVLDHGVCVLGGSVATVSGNEITGADNDGILVKDSSLNINNNNINTVGSIGIQVENCIDSQINENTVSGTGNQGIVIEKQSNGITVSSNVISNTGSHAVSVLTGSAASVTGNEITGADNDGILVKDSSSIISNNNINTVGNIGIQLDNCSDSEISSNTLSGTTNQGIVIQTNSNGITVSANEVSETGKDAISVLSGSRAVVDGNNVSGITGHGVLIKASNSTVNNNSIGNVSGCGIYADKDATVTISGNTVDNAQTDGINIATPAARVSGNTVNSPVTGMGIVVKVTTGAQGNTIVSNNTVNNSKNKGILVQNTTNAIISNNMISNGQEKGMYVLNTSNTEVSGNQVKDCADIGILCTNCKELSVISNNAAGNTTADIYVNNGSTGRAEGNTVGSAGIKTKDSPGFTVV